MPKEEFVSTVTQESLSQQVNTKSPDNFTIQVGLCYVHVIFLHACTHNVLYSYALKDRPTNIKTKKQVQNPDVAPKPELKHISTQKLFINPTKVFKELDQHATQVSLDYYDDDGGGDDDDDGGSGGGVEGENNDVNANLYDVPGVRHPPRQFQGHLVAPHLL